jgi:hypothetical protein
VSEPTPGLTLRESAGDEPGRVAEEWVSAVGAYLGRAAEQRALVEHAVVDGIADA